MLSVAELIIINKQHKFGIAINKHELAGRIVLQAHTL